ncbi:MAG TPA: acyl-CoA desaturase, partial [Pseudonocardiaceae bacterium]|nr:acyl-CoA desaturase [Pseudonocardiaceae bacterium]
MPLEQLDAPGRSTRTVDLLAGKRPLAAHISVYLFVAVPMIALVTAIPFAWGWGLSWLDIGLGLAGYTITILGVTVGYHRYFTHGAFKARRWLRVTLALVGSMAVQGPILHWVADHRRHHAFSDREGDPHSPWLFGTSPVAMVRGFWHAHMGWIFERDVTNQRRFAPDLLADKDIRIVHRLFGVCTVATLLLPSLI